ncbi:MAG TPA: stage III sporulation protein AD [Lachnospiraceae bacterium]|nr:stage III sporulation protein AD [Lachnospiraceae bacterium]
MNILKIAAVGIIGTFLALQLKSGKAEYGIYLASAVSIIIFFALLDHLEGILNALRAMEEELAMNISGFGQLLKMLGITYIAEFAGSICRDAGYQTIAGQIEVFAKLSILVLSLPILMALLDTIHAFLS